MSLRLKFNLVLGLAMALGIAISGIFSYEFLHQNAREEILDRARIMLESAIAVRGYTVSEIRPLLALQQKRKFLPQTVPAYGAHRFIEKLQLKYPEYSYKEAVLNPTNPESRATDWETDIVEWYRANPDSTELVGERDTATGQFMYLSHPIKITNEACLTCHSTPERAPETMLARYGDSNGFGWELNEIVGAQIVSIPMSVPLERAKDTFYVFMMSLVGVFIFVGVLLNIVLHKIVLKPVIDMASTADKVSMGALDTPELNFDGNDEISSLSHSFNRMHRSLKNAMDMLDNE